MRNTSEQIQPYTLVTHKLNSRVRHNGIFFFVEDLPRSNRLFENFRLTKITRQDTGTNTLLLHSKAKIVQPLLGLDCLEAHVSIEEWFLNKHDLLSAAHIKMIFGSFAIRIYIDQHGEKKKLKVKEILEGGHESRLDDDNPTVELIKEQIFSHPRVVEFQQIIDSIFEQKHKALLELYQSTMEEETQLSNQLSVVGTLDSKVRKKLISKIHEFIKNINTINRYDNDEQDRRADYYLKIIETINQPIAQITTIVNTSEVLDSSTSIGELTANAPPVKNARKEIRVELVQLVDSIITSISEVQEMPMYMQFMHVYTLLEELKILSLSIAILDKDNSSRSFIDQQMQRLPFKEWSFDNYFYNVLCSGTIDALEFLLPHLSTAQKYTHYSRLLEDILLPETSSRINYGNWMYLYNNDKAFKFVIKMHSCIFSITNEGSHKIAVSMLARLFIINNINAFRAILSFREGNIINRIHMTIDGTQYNILNACIYLYSHNPNSEFIRILFEHGLSINHRAELFSQDTIRCFDFKNFKSKRTGSSVARIEIKESDPGREVANNSLLIALSYKDTSQYYDLIEELVKHSDLMTLTKSVAFLLTIQDVNMRIIISHSPFVCMTKNFNTCNKLMMLFSPGEGQKKYISILSYLVSAESDEVEQRRELLKILLERLSFVINETTVEKCQETIDLLIQESKEEQRNSDYKKAIANIISGIIIWILIGDHNNEKDYEHILQLLFIRGMLITKLHTPKHGYLSYKLGKDLIEDPTNTMSKALKETSIFKIISRALEQGKSLFADEDIGFFARPTSNTSTSSSVAAAQETEASMTINT